MLVLDPKQNPAKEEKLNGFHAKKTNGSTKGAYCGGIVD
jgi:hypothetical protein